MLLNACLNGPRDVTEHPALPVRVASLAADALLLLPDGTPARGNPELVAAAAALIAGRSGLRR